MKHDKTKGKQRKDYKLLRILHRGLDIPSKDKMVREPERKKGIYGIAD